MSRRVERMLARDRASLARFHRERERETMSDEEIDRRMVKAIISAALASGNVTAADFERGNIRAAAVTKARFDRCFARAREIEPALATVQAFA